LNVPFDSIPRSDHCAPVAAYRFGPHVS
jgi:hypothetical protein